ncbi:hypothetical protein BOTBODRAFT_29149 [Botryobasidium botryosum FD-172 SS1]|uniref:Uncharacterized protein n=1 Tax=Botryobasidium botryosum (strain FD-172 SS1) TaxID=930990 RepID=A0A067N150_BOTB1|nr:hypothetical protein BOTBODRAFT_29149 [Botryobasidium botryosum FD-172 SS1]
MPLQKFTLASEVWTELTSLWPVVAEGQLLATENLLFRAYSCAKTDPTSKWNVLSRRSRLDKTATPLCCIPRMYEDRVRHIVYHFNSLTSVLQVPFSSYEERAGEPIKPYTSTLLRALNLQLIFLEAVIERAAGYINATMHRTSGLYEPRDLPYNKALEIKDPHIIDWDRWAEKRRLRRARYGPRPPSGAGHPIDDGYETWPIAWRSIVEEELEKLVKQFTQRAAVHAEHLTSSSKDQVETGIAIGDGGGDGQEGGKEQMGSEILYANGEGEDGGASTRARDSVEKHLQPMSIEKYYSDKDGNDGNVRASQTATPQDHILHDMSNLGGMLNAATHQDTPPQNHSTRNYQVKSGSLELRDAQGSPRFYLRKVDGGAQNYQHTRSAEAPLTTPDAAPSNEKDATVPRGKKRIPTSDAVAPRSTKRTKEYNTRARARANRGAKDMGTSFSGNAGPSCSGPSKPPALRYAAGGGEQEERYDSEVLSTDGYSS